MATYTLDLTEDLHPAADFQSKAQGLLRQVQDTRRPVVLTEEGRGAAVLVDLNTYQSLLEELDLLRDVHRGLADIEAGRVVPHEEVRAHFLSRFK